MPQGLDNLIGAVGDAIKTAPTFYEDALQPTVQETGKILALIPQTIESALLPLRKWNIDREYKFAETKKMLEYKLQNIDPDKIVTPEAYVAVPAIQAISYSMDSEELRNLYANLLAKSMNSDSKDAVHPSFVEIIKQMSPIDVQIFEIIRNSKVRPLITLSICLSNGGLIPINKNCSWINRFSLDQCCASFNNLSRLGLITIPAIGEYTYPEHYSSVKENVLFIEAEKLAQQRLENGSSIFYEKHFIELSDFSDLFYSVCSKNDFSIIQ